MSQKSKHPHNHQPATPHKDSPQKENYNRHVFVEPGAQIDLVDDLKNEYKSANTGSTTHNRKALVWVRITAIFTVLYFFVTGLIYLASKKSADAAFNSAETSKNTLTWAQEQF